MEFNPNNHIVKLCLQGMELEGKGELEEASNRFLQAWNESTNEFEKFMTAFFISRHQKSNSHKIKWLETSLQLALKINNDSVKPAFSFLYESIAKCYEDLNDSDNAKKNYELANKSIFKPSDKGPFYHGTKANLKIGDLLTAGFNSNYKPDLTMNHIYFTAIVNGAGLAASLAKGDGLERVYMVEPIESFENDPNVTNKKFPGNPTRSYRTEGPLKIIGEVKDWAKQTTEDIQKWRDRLANNKGEIIN